jgi:hypothetical protein
MRNFEFGLGLAQILQQQQAGQTSASMAAISKQHHQPSSASTRHP